MSGQPPRLKLGKPKGDLVPPDKPLKNTEPIPVSVPISHGRLGAFLSGLIIAGVVVGCHQKPDEGVDAPEPGDRIDMVCTPPPSEKTIGSLTGHARKRARRAEIIGVKFKVTSHPDLERSNGLKLRFAPKQGAAFKRQLHADDEVFVVDWTNPICEEDGVRVYAYVQPVDGSAEGGWIVHSFKDDLLGVKRTYLAELPEGSPEE